MTDETTEGTAKLAEETTDETVTGGTANAWTESGKTAGTNLMVYLSGT